MPDDALPAGCLRCGSDRLTWTLSANELPHAECADWDGDTWTMIGSRYDRIREFYDQLGRIAARKARRRVHEADLIDPR